MTRELEPAIADRLIELARRLVDQRNARVLVPPYENASGFWFGGGDLMQLDDGGFVLVGRYRNVGDSRTGLAAGERGLECALLRAPAFAGPYEKCKSFSKADLAVAGKTVTSIEGTAFRRTADGFELFVSSEKDVAYPEAVREYQKPGTGVWSIDAIAAGSIDELDAASIREVLASDEPASLHVKDPVLVDDGGGETRVLFCIHPFAWSSSSTGLAVRGAGEGRFRIVSDCVLPRGPVWDVAAARVTDRLRVPRLGALRDLPPLSLYFYDGAECLRRHEAGAAAVQRPRGWSCEEIGGMAWCFDADFPHLRRLSVHFPLFVSPHGTGCSRYVSTLATADAVYATWQQSQGDESQPLVGHGLPMERVEQILQ